MHRLCHLGAIAYGIIQRQSCEIISSRIRCKISNENILRALSVTASVCEKKPTVKALRSMKPKSTNDTLQQFVDITQVRTIGGNGGDGQISFLRLWVNDRAGPDGGDGGHGGHVIFEASSNVKDLKHINSVIKAKNGEKGYSKNCFGKNAEHNVVNVPIGTIVRDVSGTILADLDKTGMMFIAARGGAGGHGNAFFTSDTQQAPEICEYGATGEDLQYVLETRSMAHIGLLGLPNAGKSTLLRAISRARPKVAAYPFTTLKPHIGMIQYDDYEQVAVADMPGLIEDSHKNRGLGITFLKHAERCAALVFILDITVDEPWKALETLKYEISQFNEKLNERPHIIVANKIDLPNAEINLQLLREHINLPIIPISAKIGTNISTLLNEIRTLYDNLKANTSEENSELFM
ncbi:mitochondrial ribosome-associated GTPase 2 isoform X2 [Pogonomyrmex barbatus]|nr:mitochondrial ribosome-associated GTPase 2 isoform X2 [Pogonomyrmex barbatus]